MNLISYFKLLFNYPDDESIMAIRSPVSSDLRFMLVSQKLIDLEVDLFLLINNPVQYY